MKKIFCLSCFFVFTHLLFVTCSKTGSNPSGSSGAAVISINPTSGGIGTLLTITETNFDLSTLSSVTVNGVAANIVSQSTTSATALIMPGTTTDPVIVITNAGSQTGDNFTVTMPSAGGWSQQGTKLVGTGNIGAAWQGLSVAISADGNTALIGGNNDNASQGAAWIFTRSGSVWVQQGSKLIVTDNIGVPSFGASVALSADGTTALVGGVRDNSNQGASWVFTRSGSVWTQQGSKLVGTGNIGTAMQGNSVALSANGNTAIVSGNADNSYQGAVWVFIRNNGTWTQQGSKLVGSGAVGTPNQGYKVSLSADGNTAVVGGVGDNSNQGAAWIFTQSNGTWTQQGTKLVGTGAVGAAWQGTRTAISSDGNTVLIGGYSDNTNQGAVWVFTRSSGIWSQQGSKLVGSGNTGAAWQTSVALSADGNTALIGGYRDNGDVGAIWIFIRGGGIWSQQGSKLVGTGNIGAAYQGYSVALSADGSTAFIGGDFDNSNQGAAWVFTH
ncbi:MAG: hypothetical protein JSR44_09760 [Spirochaetes bacterium]|nr:hypothetical protein [Spirochaetota bacterium]